MRPFQHILLTGASSGIGAALARQYAARGVVLGLMGRNGERLEEVAKICRDKGAQVITGSVDVRDAASMRHWIETFDDAHPIDLAIACAGVSGGTAEGSEKEENIRFMFEVNVNGVLNTIHPVMTRMRERRKGQIGVVASLAGYRGFPGAPAYCATKAAVKVYGEALRGHLMKDNVGVSVICPGFIDTPMTQINPYRMPFLTTPEKAARIIAKGLARNKARIAFPLPMAFGVWLLAALPSFLTDPFLKNMPGKPLAGFGNE